MELSLQEAAQRSRRSPRTIQRWYRARRAMVTPDQFEKRVRSSLEHGRRPATPTEFERQLLARIRMAILKQPRPDGATLETYRRLRIHLDQHGTSADLPSRLRQICETRLCLAAPIPEACMQKVERETVSITRRGIVWFQAYELLRTGAVLWDQQKPTTGELTALGCQPWPQELRVAYKHFQEAWGDVSEELDLLLDWPDSALRTPAVISAADKRIQPQLIARLCKRFKGHPRLASLDSDTAYLLGITRQSAFYLRRTVEKYVGHRLRL